MHGGLAVLGARRSEGQCPDSGEPIGAAAQSCLWDPSSEVSGERGAYSSAQDGRWQNRVYMAREARRQGQEVELAFSGRVVAVPDGQALPKGPKIILAQPHAQ